MRRGVVRRIDELGRIVIPREFLKTLNWMNRPNVEMSQFGDWVLVRRAGGAGAARPKVPQNNPAQIKLIEEIQKLSAKSILVLLELAEVLNEAETTAIREESDE